MTKAQLKVVHAQPRAEQLYLDIVKCEADAAALMESAKAMRDELMDIVKAHGEQRGKSIFLQTAPGHESRVTTMERTSLADEDAAIKWALSHGHSNAVTQRIDNKVWKALKLPDKVRARFEKTSSGEVLYV